MTKLQGITGGINLNSPKQLAEFLYDTLGFAELTDRRGNPIRTGGGQPCTGAEVIARLQATNSEQRTFLELKTKQGELNAKLTKALVKFKECCEKSGGLLHASFNQTVSFTGRYTSTGKYYTTQLQNLAREFKPLFRARNVDWLVGEADEAQLEFRTAVYFGQDKQGFEDVANKFDVHTFTAGIIGCDRQAAKPHTFKPLYGGVSGTEREKEYYRAFREKYKDITATQDQWVETALRSKMLVLDTGQRWHFDDLKITKSGYIEGNTKVRNYPVQYLATAEIVPLFLVYVWHQFKARKMQTFITNTVHDSIICEIFPPETELFREIMVKGGQDFPVEYMKKLYGIEFNVPLEVEVKVGPNWGEGKKL
jgi:DNA polymerase I-like protein with 3'-5' exonuclease and polymerase domains